MNDWFHVGDTFSEHASVSGLSKYGFDLQGTPMHQPKLITLESS